jgi:hypothetical protein
MSTRVTIDVPDELARRAAAVAAATNRRLEDVVSEWLGRAAGDLSVEAMGDVELMAACDATMPPDQEHELSALLADLREGELAPGGRARLDELMASYRRGLVLKARATRGAVARGLLPPIGAAGDAA